MSPRHLVRSAALILAAVGLTAISAATPRGEDSTTTSWATPTVTRYYTMTARIRPLLIWMTRDEVGGARISWSGNRSNATLELLVGSDPERAPMGINRWGFIREQSDGGIARLVGLMTETDDRSIDAARKNAASMNRSQAYRSVRAVVQDQDATSTVQRVVFDRDFTYQHYAALLDRVPSDAGREQRLHLAPGTEPGFLFAMKALMHESVQHWQRTRRSPGPIARNYVYTGKLYRLSLRRTTPVKNALVGAHEYGEALEGSFEIRGGSGSDSVAEFQMSYTAGGAHPETPLRLVYRPRWWIELNLQLVDPRDSPPTFAMRLGDGGR